MIKVPEQGNRHWIRKVERSQYGSIEPEKCRRGSDKVAGGCLIIEQAQDFKKIPCRSYTDLRAQMRVVFSLYSKTHPRASIICAE